MNQNTEAISEALRQSILSTVDILETVVHELADTLDEPHKIERGDGFEYKYPEPWPKIVCVLKSVRIVSSLDAICVLLESGHTSEATSLARGVIDFSDEILFLMVRDEPDGSPSTQQQQFVAEFFAQKMPTPEARAKGLQKPNMVPKKKMHAANARLLEKMGIADTSSVTRLLGNSHAVHSGYVHGSYRSIMETYRGGCGGRRGAFHMRGLKGTPRISEHTRNAASVTHDSIVAVAMLASMLSKQHLFDQLEEQLNTMKRAMAEFDKTMGLNRKAD